MRLFVIISDVPIFGLSDDHLVRPHTFHRVGLVPLQFIRVSSLAGNGRFVVNLVGPPNLGMEVIGAAAAVAASVAQVAVILGSL